MQRPAPGQELWIARFDPGPEDRDSEPTDLAVDREGNLIAAGFIQTAKQDVDFLIARFTPDGKLLWQQRYNGPANDVDRARSVCVDGRGYIYVTGDSDGGKGNQKTRLSGLDYAVLKLDRNGTKLWEARYNGPGNGEDVPCKVRVDAHGNVYVTGSSWEREVKERRDPQGWAFATVKFDRNGRRVWARRHAPEKDVDYRATDLHVFDDGSLCVTGVAMRELSNHDQQEIVTILYQPNGDARWIRVVSTEDAHPWETAKLGVDAQGNLIVAVGAENAHAQEKKPVGALVVKFDPQGREVWRRVLTDTRVEASLYRLCDLVIAEDGDIALLGEITLPPATAQYSVMRLDPQGAARWVCRAAIRPDMGAIPERLRLTRDGAVIVSGSAYNPSPGHERDYLTIAFGPDGKERWRSLFNNRWNAADRVGALALFPDGSVAVAGQSYGGETNDLVLLRYSR